MSWKEEYIICTSTKMRAMYDYVFDTESAAVAYPWVLYWFTGMTEQEVYDLAYASHDFYRQVETDRVKWSTDVAGSKIGAVSYTWNYGTQVSDNIKELWAALDNNGIDVWICSASATDPIRAAIDVWGGHDHITGMMAMTNKLDADGKYINEYDWDGGQAWLAKANGKWEKLEGYQQKTQTQGEGKVIAVSNICLSQYDGYGPIAGFMDSTGDYNFCTEFKSLEVVCCFNRADRKETDGGGVIAEVAVYEADTLGYDYAKAREAGDTLYVLQGRNEFGLRGFNPGRATSVFKQGKEKDYVFGSEYGRGNNEAQLQCMIDNKLSVETAINDFAIKTAANDAKYNLPFKYGFVTGVEGEGLGEKFGIDFSGYHTQA